jgi:hypothetical protein
VAEPERARVEQADEVLLEARIGERVDEYVAAVVNAQEDVVEEERVGEEFRVVGARVEEAHVHRWCPCPCREVVFLRRLRRRRRRRRC